MYTDRRNPAVFVLWENSFFLYNDIKCKQKGQSIQEKLLSWNLYKFFEQPVKTGAGAYRYGFNGKERMDEAKDGGNAGDYGYGNLYDYGARVYDPRVGRFLSVDPLTGKYPMLTPYQFAGNSPLANIDLDGAEPKPATTGKEYEGEAVPTSETEYNNMGVSVGTKTTVWYWHAGGLVSGQKLNKDKTGLEKTYTLPGRYTSDQYVHLLSGTDAAKALAHDLSLYNPTADAVNGIAISEGHKELEKFAGHGINGKAAAHLISAAKQTADNANFASTGTTRFSSFNVEDMLGVALLLKEGATSLGGFLFKGSNTIYRVVSPEEAADVLKNGFRQAPLDTKISSYEGKLFWSTPEDARWYQNWVGRENPILKVKVDKGFFYETGADAGRLFYYVSPEQLEQFNTAVKSTKIMK